MMKKQFWVGPPEHGKSEDLVELWTEPGEVSAQPPKGSKHSKSVPFLLLGQPEEQYRLYWNCEQHYKLCR